MNAPTFAQLGGTETGSGPSEGTPVVRHLAIAVIVVAFAEQESTVTFGSDDCHGETT